MQIGVPALKHLPSTHVADLDADAEKHSSSVRGTSYLHRQYRA